MPHCDVEDRTCFRLDRPSDMKGRSGDSVHLKTGRKAREEQESALFWFPTFASGRKGGKSLLLVSLRPGILSDVMTSSSHFFLLFLITDFPVCRKDCKEDAIRTGTVFS